ncbi:hypothetical protein BKA70DRAFT_578859 [Coprinopsis sp. MPI-PUGE-AT-0042]|nr:hypothetical protein BKA70DRAFT_578859 [Coprinopsis sp. MPI-PUGE-AT-0042]
MPNESPSPPTKDCTPTIASLPNETLSAILLSVAQAPTFPTDVREKHAALLQLGLVCHRWHDTIRSEPRLWTECSVAFVGNRKTSEEEKRQADQATINALEAFYAISGSSLGLTFECHCQRTPTQQVVSQLNHWLTLMGRRWTRMELDSREWAEGDGSASWIYAFMNLATEEKDRLGYSPFDNVVSLKMFIPAIQRFPLAGVPTGLSMWVDVIDFPLYLLFPNLTKLHLDFSADIRNAERLHEMLALKHLTSLRFSGSYDNVAVLQDLLSQLPILKHLDVWGVVPDPSRVHLTHHRLESFTTRDGRFHDRCSALSFPSLQHLTLGHAQYWPSSPSDVALSNVTTLLTNPPLQLRELKVDKNPFNEVDLFRLLIRLPVLEKLALQVPLNEQWETMEGSMFRSLLGHGSTSLEMPLPRLREIVMHMGGKVPSKEEGDDGSPVYGKAEFTGFCTLRDAFIDFVEDPRRQCSTGMDPPENAAERTAEEGCSLGSVVAQLELAHFNHTGIDGRSTVIYHRGTDFVEPLLGGDKSW